MISSTVRIGLLGLVALLALTGLGSGVLAAGDLFDDAYKDCPHKTRLRDGQIDDLAVNRDADDEDHVNVSWSATDPATWGLGPNAYTTSLVVILDDQDGDPVAKTLSLGSTKTTFEGIKTGTEVTVQMAIVVDTAEGDYLISDILERSINQSLTAPSFSTSWHLVTNVLFPSTTFTGTVADLEFVTREVAGSLYYVGYNENFGNYKSDDTRLVTTPSTARLRIGLANTELDADGNRYASDKGPYDQVDFKAYVIRIEDADGDVVNEGNDVTTVVSSYTDHTVPDGPGLIFDHDGDGSGGTPFIQLRNPPGWLILYGVGSDPTFETGDKPEARTIGTGPNAYALSNVRVVDGDAITVAAQFNSAIEGLRTIDLGAGLGSSRVSDVLPFYLSMVKVDAFAFNGSNFDRGTRRYTFSGAGKVFAYPPNEHRDFPTDTLASDTTYTISAWAINDDDEVISPVVKLKVRPKDTNRGAIASGGFRDYLTAETALTGLTTTEFTVIK